jgi:alanine dehydrogenase
MLLLARRDVEELLDLDRLIDFLADAMADLSAGRASIPPRVAAQVDEVEGFLGVMPAHLPAADALMTKLVAVFPHNTDRPTHQAVIVCFDPQNGSPVAVMDGEYITAARTAAGSALATKLLAGPGAGVLAILGTGVQARWHARMVARVANFERIVVAGRHRDRVRRFALEMAGELALEVRVEDSFEEAQALADVVCATTHSPEPVVRRDCLRKGVHVNSVGYNPAGREVDPETVRDSYVVVESRAAALAPPPSGSNDLLWTIRDGVISEDHVAAEIGELVAGTAPGRSSEEQITLYKSVGVAVQDAAAASLVLEAARAAGVGVEVEI